MMEPPEPQDGPSPDRPEPADPGADPEQSPGTAPQVERPDEEVGEPGRRPDERPAARKGRKPGAGEERRRRRRRIALVVAAVLLLLLLVLLLWPEAVEVDAAPVTRGPLRVTVVDDGVTRVQNRYVVSAPITGQLQRIPYEEGDAVARGETVARIEPSPLDPREREAAAARLEEARAAVAQAEAALAQAEQELRRARRLAPAGAIAEQELEQAQLEAATRRAELAAARARAEAAAAELLGEPEPAAPEPAELVAVASPVSGTVLRLLEKSQRVVTAGTQLVELGDLSNLEIVVGVISTEAVEIDAGDPMIVAEWDGEPLPGRVKRVEPSGYEEVSALGVEEQRVDVIGELLVPPGPLGDQYFVEARVVTWQAANVLRVPQAALFRYGDAWAAFAIEDGRAELRRVIVGRRGETLAQVLGGLEEGEAVILYPSEEIEDGTRVEPREE